MNDPKGTLWETVSFIFDIICNKDSRFPINKTVNIVNPDMNEINRGFVFPNIVLEYGFIFQINDVRVTTENPKSKGIVKL